MSVKDAITRKLTAALSPTYLDVSDDSAQHAGHAGHRHGGESHFSVTIVSDGFSGKSRIDRHRMVNQILADELAGPVHALQVSAKAPAEG